MSTTRIPPALREETRHRAGQRCEYCLLAEDRAFLTFEADHIISEKHGGQTVSENLAWSCFDCNRFKGSDIASLDNMTGQLRQLFNPREQNFAFPFLTFLELESFFQYINQSAQIRCASSQAEEEPKARYG